MIDNPRNDFFVALLELNLPDAPDGEIVDYVQSKGIPSIVVTAEYDDTIRERILSKDIVDYVTKESTQDLDFLTDIVRRIFSNQFITAMVVDDSAPSRKTIRHFLERHKFEVIEAVDGEDALHQLERNPETKMVITDYEMPKMDGFELVTRIRKQHKKDKLAIIGMSSHGSGNLSAKFIKKGANDFIAKPFVSEEFYCRINQNIEMIEYIEAIKDVSNKDYLTSLYNRRYFFELGRKLYASSKRGHITITIAMIDIDHFKQINDTYGHDVGDEVLKRVALILGGRFRESDIVSRYGGEEFCILATNMDREHTDRIFDDVRKTIEHSETNIDDNKINITVSIGVCTELMNSLEEMIKKADLVLYEAKKRGRNRVMIDSHP